MDPRFRNSFRNLGNIEVEVKSSPETSQLLSCNAYIKEKLKQIATQSSKGLKVEEGAPRYPAPGSPERDQLIEFYNRKLNDLLFFVEKEAKKKLVDDETYTAKDFAKLLIIKIIIQQFAQEARNCAGKNPSCYLEMLKYFFYCQEALFLNHEHDMSVFEYGDNDFDEFVETLWFEIPNVKSFDRLREEESFLILQLVSEWRATGITWIKFLAFKEELYTGPLTEGAWANLFEQAHIEYKDGLNFLKKHFSDCSMKQFFPLARNNAIKGLREKYQNAPTNNTLKTLAVLLIDTNSAPANEKETNHALAILQKKVNRCKSMKELLDCYHFYKNHKILAHRRHPTYDQFREQYFHGSYPRAQIDFIATVQLKALQLQSKSPKEYDMGDLFSVQHKLNMQGHFKGHEFLEFKVRRCPDAKAIIETYDYYKEHAMVVMECCSRLGSCVGRFFKPSYTPLQKDLIYLCQSEFKKRSPGKNEPCSDLFAKKHEPHLGKRYRHTL